MGLVKLTSYRSAFTHSLWHLLRFTCNKSRFIPGWYGDAPVMGTVVCSKLPVITTLLSKTMVGVGVGGGESPSWFTFLAPNLNTICQRSPLPQTKGINRIGCDQGLPPNCESLLSRGLAPSPSHLGFHKQKAVSGTQPLSSAQNNPAGCLHLCFLSSDNLSSLGEGKAAQDSVTMLCEWVWAWVGIHDAGEVIEVGVKT